MEYVDTLDLPAQHRLADDEHAPSPSIPLTRYEWLWLLLAIAMACALRAIRPGARSLNLDEGFSYFLSQANASEFFHYLRHGELNMALYYMLLRVWPFTSSEAGLRCMSVVFGTLTVPALYLLARRLFGVAVALTAAFLLAIHPLAVELSQRARSYSLAILLVTLSGWFLVRLVDMPSKKSAAGYIASGAAAVYCHFFAILALGAQGIAMLVGARKHRHWCLMASIAVLFVLLLPCLLFLVFAPKGGLAWVPPLSTEQVTYALYSLTLSKGRSLTYILAWTLAVAALFRPRAEKRSHDLLVVSWLFLPVVTTVVLSFFHHPMLVERYLAVCIPAAVVLAARGVSVLFSASRWAAIGLLGLIVFYSASSLAFYFRHPEYGENWRAAIGYILDHAQPQDVVAVDPYTRLTFDFYLQRFHSPGNLYRWSGLAAAVSQTPEPERIWILGRKSDAGNVAGFLNQQRTYCGSSPAFATNDVMVWRLHNGCTNR